VRVIHRSADRRIRRWLGIAGVAGAVTLVAGFLTPIPAGAFDDFGIGCADDTSASIAFGSDSRWSWVVTHGPDAGKSFEEAVRSGRDMWVGHEIERWQGGYALGGGSPTMTMQFTWLTGGWASTDCIDDVVRFSKYQADKFRDGSIVLSGLAAHEWGHVWGLGHAGRHDSFGGGPPTMSTCWSDMGPQRIVSQDDSAGIQFQTNKSGRYGAATANPSFEEGFRWWGFQNVGSKQIFYSGGQDGSPNFLRFGGSGANTAIFSTTRITDSWYDGDQIGAIVKGRVNYKKAYSQSRGHVLVVAKWAHVDFSGSGQNWNECQLLPTNLNGSQSTGSYEFQRTRYCYPGSGWGYCTTLYGTVASSDSGGRKPEALQMRIVVYNRMTIGGDPVKVGIDRTRILVIPS